MRFANILEVSPPSPKSRWPPNLKTWRPLASADFDSFEWLAGVGQPGCLDFGKCREKVEELRIGVDDGVPAEEMKVGSTLR